MTTPRKRERNYWSRAREYLLSSLVSGVVVVLSDPKDEKAMIIRADPDYAITTPRIRERN